MSFSNFSILEIFSHYQRKRCFKLDVHFDLFSINKRQANINDNLPAICSYHSIDVCEFLIVEDTSRQLLSALLDVFLSRGIFQVRDVLVAKIKLNTFGSVEA